MRRNQSSSRRKNGKARSRISTSRERGTESKGFELGSLLRNLGEGLVTFDRRGRVISWNKGAERIYGYKPKEILGKTLRRTIPRDWVTEWKVRMKKVFTDGQIHRAPPVPRIRKDGKQIWIGTTTSPIKGRNGAIVGAASVIRDVTAQKLLQERLEHSEHMYRELFETSKDIIFISGRDGEFIDINEAGVKAFGYKDKADMMRLNIPRDIYVDRLDRERLQRKIARNGYAVNYEIRLRKKNGEIMDVLETSTPIHDQKGKIIAYRGILRDVTDKKLLERKLQESEEKYRSLVEHSPDGVAVTHNGKLVYANRVFALIYGYEREEMVLARPITDLVVPEQKRAVLRWFQRREASQESSKQYEFKGLRKDNRKIDVEVRVTPIRFEGEDSLLSFHRDISERKRLDEELGEAERIVGDILATMGDALVITDLHGKVLQVNREFETVTGYSRSEAFGMDFPYPWLFEEEMARFVLWIAELRTKNYLHDFDMNWLTKDNRKIAVSLNTTLLRNSRGEPIAMLNIARDISERKRLMEELEARSRQIEVLYEETLSKSLEIERRNKELDDFTYVVSHDLKEPLVTIEGYGKILRNDLPDQLGPAGTEYLDTIITAANRMKKFIDDLLALTRLSRITESFRPVSLKALLEEICRDFEFTLKERNVNLIIEDRMPVIACNESQMKLVFQNLISNAIKFNDKASPEITVGYRENRQEYWFFVKDNGIGIDQPYFEKIFGIFQRLHRPEEYGGTGVGLTIVKKIIDLHQGKIWLESKIGEGTTFHFTIPKSPS